MTSEMRCPLPPPAARARFARSALTTMSIAHASPAAIDPAAAAPMALAAHGVLALVALTPAVAARLLPLERSRATVGIERLWGTAGAHDV